MEYLERENARLVNENEGLRAKENKSHKISTPKPSKAATVRDEFEVEKIIKHRK